MKYEDCFNFFDILVFFTKFANKKEGFYGKNKKLTSSSIFNKNSKMFCCQEEK